MVSLGILLPDIVSLGILLPDMVSLGILSPLAKTAGAEAKCLLCSVSV